MKEILERQRGDQTLLTADMLNDAADIDDKHLKTILNYNLDVQRGEIEMN